MRLNPIEKPGNLLMQIVFWSIKRRFGKILQPFRFIYARSMPIFKVTYKIVTAEKKLSIDGELIRMIRYYTSHVNDCSFCSDLSLYHAMKDSDTFQEWKNFSAFKTSEKFSAAEKAVLTFIDEINTTKTTTDETFNILRRYFNDKQIVEITWVNATENYFNLMAKPLGLKSDELAETR